MKKLKLFLLSTTFKRTWHFLMYAIFAYFALELALKKSGSERIGLIIFPIIVLAFALYYEYLEYLQDKAIDYLNFKLDFSKAFATYNKVLKLDVTKSFKHRYTIFMCLLKLASFQSDEVIKLVKDNPKIFKANVQQLFLGNALLFLAYSYDHKRTKAVECFNELKPLLTFKSKKVKIKQTFNFNFLWAIYYYNLKELKKANEYLALVDSSYMNNRELCEFHYFNYLINQDPKSYDAIKALHGQTYLERLTYEG